MMTLIATEAEAIDRLAKYYAKHASKHDLGELEWHNCLPEAASEYVRMLAGNVSALMSEPGACWDSTEVCVAYAVKLTQATIAGLEEGEQ